MMLLALDTSTLKGSIALVSHGQLIAEYQIGIRQTSSEVLLPLIDQMLHASGNSISDVDAFAVAQGPGSFTALRVGMSLMTGLALAAGKRLVPVPSLDGLAYNACLSVTMICPLIDARRGEVYGAFYRMRAGEAQLERLSPYLVFRPDSIIEHVAEPVLLLGEGAALYREVLVDKLGDKALFAPLHLNIPRASAIAALALQVLSGDGPTGDDTPVPLYVRPPDAQIK